MRDGGNAFDAAVAAAKAAVEYANRNNKLTIVGGGLEGQVLDEAGASADQLVHVLEYVCPDGDGASIASARRASTRGPSGIHRAGSVGPKSVSVGTPRMAPEA